MSIKKFIIPDKNLLFKIDKGSKNIPEDKIISDVPSKGTVMVMFITQGQENHLSNFVCSHFIEKADIPGYIMWIKDHKDYKEIRDKYWKKYNIVKNCTIMIMKDGKELARADGNVKISQVKKLWSLFSKV